jgi:hypothetical protein
MRTITFLLITLVLVAWASETATLTGAAYDMTGEPVPEASVELFLAADTGEEEEEKERSLELEDHPWLFVDEPLYATTTDGEGRYRLEDILPGHYDARCRHDYYEPVYALDLDFTAGEDKSQNFAFYPLEEVEKPNLYLYPQAETEVTVRLEFPAGGGVTISKPDYGDGWTVKVAPDGLIDGEYGHLFYEAQVPPGWQFDRAWVVQRRLLEDFFAENLAAHGFSETEAADFVEHWVPRLDDKDFYVVYPQYAREIEPLIGLVVEPEPDCVLRLYYAISGVDLVERYVPEPDVPSFNRESFTVCEWGVVLLPEEGLLK